MSRIDWTEATGIATIFAILIGLPIILWQWRDRTLHRHSADTKVISLTAVAGDGVWTQDDVVGWNYWWKTPARAENIPLQLNDHVIMRLRSVDVLHSFAIPLLHIGPVEVPSGHTVEVEFRADRPGTLTFLCWQVCSQEHQNLRGRFVVAGNAQDSW